MKFEGNNRIFRTYFKGDDAGDGKKPCQAVKGMPGLPFAEAAKNPSFGAVLNEGFVDISFDTKEMFEAFLDMADANNWRCLALESAKGGHTYWKDSGHRTGKNGKDKPLAVGLIADIHSGSTYIPLKVHGVEREVVFDGEDYQEVPPELLPVKTSARLWGLSEGEGRNDELFKYILTLQECGLDRKTIRHILTGEPHEKWTALYSLSDKCRIAGGQNSSKKRTEILL